MADVGEATSGQRFTNSLIHAVSPYLLQHAHNPVEWQEWGAEALERARREDKPIFLSVGYAACHWCHVMEREVFENEGIAAVMNRHFVCVKVDREERPDIDEVYMLATQVATGSGGWPMSVFLTPALAPFYAGTYFPAVDAMGRPGFGRLCAALAEAWEKNRAALLAQAKRLTGAVAMYADEAVEGGPVELDVGGWVAAAVREQRGRFDGEHGGLGSSPKFPPHTALHLWLAVMGTEKQEAGSKPPPSNGLTTEYTEITEREESSPPSGRTLKRELQTPPPPTSPEGVTIREMLEKTLDGMMRGGIYDQVGGGFHRYATDEAWRVPHFEKMLYDNALLAGAYALAAVRLGREDYARVARQTLDFWLREMSYPGGHGEPGGAFYSSLDADSEGQEGKYYVWTVEEIREALPRAEDAELILRHLGVTAEGNWTEGGAEANVLYVAEARAAGGGEAGRIEALCGELRKARERRVRPGLDDKILTAWNGLMISAMAIAGRVLKEPRYLEAAHRAVGYLLMQHMERGRDLVRMSRPGTAAAKAVPAFLEDHAALLNALCDLVEATLPTSLPGTMARKRALELADTMIRRFWDAEQEVFNFTTEGHERLFARVRNATDGAIPSANGMAIRALLRLARGSGKETYREVAMRAVGSFAGPLQKQPAYFCTVLQGLVEDGKGGAERAAAPVAVVSLGIEGAGHLTVQCAGLGPVRAGETIELPLTVRIAAGYHIQAREPADREAFATVARLQTALPLAGQEWAYPAGAVYAGSVVIRARLTVAKTAAPGRYAVRATVLAQPCTEAACLAPERATVEVGVEVVGGENGAKVKS